MDLAAPAYFKILNQDLREIDRVFAYSWENALGLYLRKTDFRSVDAYNEMHGWFFVIDPDGGLHHPIIDNP